jgi:AraC family transcriptional regulator of adaptative response/methylated-DNA-[protein]-cysteine methyltransferase
MYGTNNVIKMMNDQNPYSYDVIKRSLAIIDKSDFPMSLNDLASELSMSPAHFQRLFSTWVGVSPKAYQQYLSLNLSRELLRDRFTTLETALNSGLSGTGRLHDLFIKWEAMSPGTYANHAEGLTIHYDWYQSPFGDALIMATDIGVCGIAFSDETGRSQAYADMVSRWNKATFIQGGRRLDLWADAIFAQKGDATLALIGAPFQIKVWEALLQIPSGYVTTYSEIARTIGSPRAVRAVGTAVGRNPISWLIPCHRALRKDGALGGYHWGLGVKRALLAFETARLDVSE